MFQVRLFCLSVKAIVKHLSSINLPLLLIWSLFVFILLMNILKLNCFSATLDIGGVATWAEFAHPLLIDQIKFGPRRH